MSFLVVSTVVAVLGMAILVAYHDQPNEYPNDLGALQEHYPVETATGHIAYGLYRQPVTGLDLAANWDPVSKFWSLKRWHYFSLDTPKIFLGAAVAHLNYAANGFFYIYDKTNQTKYEYTSLSPLGWGVGTSDSPISGCFTWEGKHTFSLCAQPEQATFQLKGQLELHAEDGRSVSFQVNATAQRAESLSMLYPITAQGDRSAFTNKAAGMRAKSLWRMGTGAAEVAAAEWNEEQGLAVSDYTYSFARRVTIWKWCSFSTFAKKAGSDDEPVALGINLSDEVYNSAAGISQENSLWINGKVYRIGQVSFELPAAGREHLDQWTLKTVASSTGGSSPSISIDLHFTPRGSREEHIHAVVIASDFVQPFGDFTGHIRIQDSEDVNSGTYEIEQAFGVVENHYAKW